LLGDEPVLSAQEIFYQRLLAMDQDEARRIVETHLQEHSLESLYESVLIPALRLAEEDRHMDALGTRTSEFIYQGTRELIEDLGDRFEKEDAEAKTVEGESETVRSPTPSVGIVCLPARDEADELVGMMLSQLLRRSGNGVHYLPIGTVDDMLEQVSRGNYRITCVSALPPFAVGQARSLCKRLRARFPDLAIVVGLWDFAGGVPKAQERVGPSCTDAVATTLTEAMLQVRRLAETVQTDHADAVTSCNSAAR
jgi:hypothetical protein